MKEKEKLSHWINKKTLELKEELDALPEDPTGRELNQYKFITSQLLKLAQMKAKHFPPKKDPDPRFLEVLY